MCFVLLYPFQRFPIIALQRAPITGSPRLYCLSVVPWLAYLWNPKVWTFFQSLKYADTRSGAIVTMFQRLVSIDMTAETYSCKALSCKSKKIVSILNLVFICGAYTAHSFRMKIFLFILQTTCVLIIIGWVVKPCKRNDLCLFSTRLLVARFGF